RRAVGKPERPGAVTMKRYTRWTLACTMPLMLLSAGRAQFSQTYEGFRQTAMRSDLRNLVEAQERASSDSGHFTLHPGLLHSPGISPPAITLTPTGWTAKVTPSVT